MKNIAHKKAVAMIELIFAIVVMAIVLMGAPLLISQSTKSSFVGLQQESINILSTHISLILTKEWDEANANIQLRPSLLRVNSGDVGLNISGDRYRTGTFTPSKRTFATDGGGNNIEASLLATFGDGLDAGSFNDMDDYNDAKTIISVFNDEASSSDYVDKNIEINTEVAYGSDALSSGAYGVDSTLVFNQPFNARLTNSSNIKIISVVLTSNSKTTELNKNIRLSAFSCNIGNFSLQRRSI